MLNENFQKSLERINKILTEKSIEWILIGTAAQDLQGMDRDPNDIDVVIRKNKLNQARNIFKDHNPSPIEKLRKGHYKFAFNLEVPIEIIGQVETEEFFNNKDKFIVFKELNQRKYPCRRLEKEIDFYKKMNRLKRVKEIKNFLKNEGVDKRKH